ncbi:MULTISPECIES: ABC transporter permease [Clostridium]|uniref:Spermidine/putrescine transport system permease protein PotB n=2 Tax=Clostridium TaxID=1485 RepID=A0A151AKH4_9CLOT|nr:MULTISPECIES: ABC transporter permease [Clostridium]KYH28118.1 spermidine/putrescine transport system permease protein PotB [Clostridium colicanis DSM 13634]PRR70532.1 Spermidine/putrescine transport system permease protein PotB [Clostridium thermopalmarium DSM 5974]PVZ21280.1 ABC-type spermidine/putrescine transport system permease subunit I [Clostridium thermopalmarium DSM 5974]
MENRNSLSRIMNKLKEKAGMIATVMPVTLWMLAFFIVPLILILIVSFSSRGETGNIIFKFTLNNYARIFNKLYITIFIKSLLIGLATTVICLVLGYPFAFIIARAGKRLKPLFLLLIILPFWTNSLVRTYAMIILLRTEGILNHILLGIGLINEPLHLMYNNIAVMIGMLYMMFPFMVLPLYSSIEKLDMSLLEAADDLGASPLNKFLKITLPLTKGGILSGSLLVFVPTLGLFFITDLMGGSKVVLMSNLVKNQFLTARDWPFGSAISVILMIVMIILIFYYTKFSGNKNKWEVL